MLPFLYRAFLRRSGFWGFRNSLLSGSFFKARGSLRWLPLDWCHGCLSLLSFISWWASPAAHLACVLCACLGLLQRSASTLYGYNLKKKTNSWSSIKSQQAGEDSSHPPCSWVQSAPCILRGWSALPGAGLSGPAFEPGGQLTTPTSSSCLCLSGWVDITALSGKQLLLLWAEHQAGVGGHLILFKGDVSEAWRLNWLWPHPRGEAEAPSGEPARRKPSITNPVGLWGLQGLISI